MSAHSPKKEGAVLGPFMVAEYKAGSSVLLRRNPNYWKKDSQGRRLPYLDSIRLDIQSNRDVEMLRFRRGELDLINVLDSDYFDRLASTSTGLAHDAGASLDSDFLWFNQVANAPIPEYKRAWFRSANFRRAISQAINRDDLARVVFNGHAQPAVGPVLSLIHISISRLASGSGALAADECSPTTSPSWLVSTANPRMLAGAELASRRTVKHR